MSADQPRRRRVFLWSAVFGYSGLAFTLARNVLLVPLYLHYIALGEFGAWLATGGALAQLLVADFGLSGVITQRIAARAGGNDAAAVRAMVSAGIANALLIALVLGAASLLIAVWLPATQGLEEAQRARVFDCFLIAVAANCCGIVAMAAMAALRGAQRAVAAGSVSLAADVASVGVTLGCVLSGLGLYGIALGLLTRSVLAAAGALLALRECWWGVNAPGKWNWRDSIAMWRDSGRFFVTSIAMRLQSQANILFVGSILGPHSAAIYGLTVRAHETVHIFMGQLNSAYGPVLAHLAGAGQQERFDAVVCRVLPLVAALAAVCTVGVVVLNESFVSLWAGAETYGGLALTLLMGLALWVTSVAFVGYEALVARGEFAFIARVFAAGALLHIAILFAGLDAFGPSTAPVALLCSSLLWGALAWRRVSSHMMLSAQLRHAGGEVAMIGLAALAAGATALALVPAASSWPALAGEMLLIASFVAGLLLAVRPSLRRALLEEISTTLRSMRAA